MTLRAICKRLELGPLGLANLSKIPFSSIRGYYYADQEPSFSRGQRIIQTLQLVNTNKGLPVDPDSISSLWRNGRPR